MEHPRLMQGDWSGHVRGVGVVGVWRSYGMVGSRPNLATLLCISMYAAAPLRVGAAGGRCPALRRGHPRLGARRWARLPRRAVPSHTMTYVRGAPGAPGRVRCAQGRKEQRICRRQFVKHEWPRRSAPHGAMNEIFAGNTNLVVKEADATETAGWSHCSS